MTWVRLDDDFPNHPKILRAGPIAELIQVRALCYASHHLTNGFIPRAAVPALLLGLGNVGVMFGSSEQGITSGTDALDVDWPCELITRGLWKHDPKREGYWIHDYLDYQPSRKEVLKSRESTRIRVSRWRDRNSSRNGLTPHVSNSVTDPVVTASPDPDPDLKKQPPKAPLVSASPDGSNGAALGWASVRKALTAGASTLPPFKDPKVPRVVDAMGGWDDLRPLQHRDAAPAAFAARRREFVELYRAIE